VNALCWFLDLLKADGGIDEIAQDGFGSVWLGVNSSELMMLCASVCCNIQYHSRIEIKVVLWWK
jgi:hypothetical protein